MSYVLLRTDYKIIYEQIVIAILQQLLKVRQIYFYLKPSMTNLNHRNKSVVRQQYLLRGMSKSPSVKASYLLVKLGFWCMVAI